MQGDKKPVVMTEDIDQSVAKKLHAAQHASGGSDPITPAAIGALNKAGDMMTGQLSISITNDSVTGLIQWGGNSILRNSVDDKNYADFTLSSNILRYSRNVNGVPTDYDILHTGNKPSGSYTGTGVAWSEPLNIGGIGQFLMITLSGARFAIVGRSGAVILNTSGRVTEYLTDAEVHFRNGVLTMITANDGLNRASWYYDYQVL